MCAGFNLGWDYVFPFNLEICASHIRYAAREYLLDGGNHNKSVVEQTFEVMSRMSLKPNKDFVFEAAGRHLCLCLSQVYDRYTRYRRDYAVIGEVLKYAQFKKQLEHSDYFVAKNKPKWIDGATKRVWIVDFEKLSLTADVSAFVNTGQEENQTP